LDALSVLKGLEEEQDATRKLSGLMDGIEYEDHPQSPHHRQNQTQDF
jgi:hypothetical protein